MTDDRIVHVRTSASAKDFWSRPRSEEVQYAAKSFRIPHGNDTTPYKMQRDPFSPLPPYSPGSRLHGNNLSQSRDVERCVLTKDIDNADCTNETLRKEVKRLQIIIERILRINQALTKEIVQMHDGSSQ